MINVTLEDVKKAAEVLDGVISKTKLMECNALSTISGNNVYLKLENLQKTGSFKIRGAYNKIASLTEEERNNGVIASSAGNHAQGVALGAKMNNIKATIVMPATAPLAKVSNTRAYGAEVVLNGTVYDDAYAKAVELQKETGATFLHPFNDPYVIAGQGTIALEILDEVKDMDAIMVPIGGGGIVAGIAVAAKAINPDIKIIGVEAAGAASMKAAVAKGEVVELDKAATIADGIAVKKAGDLTFEIVQKYVDEIVTVEEEEIAQAILFLMEKDKIVAEGSGAVCAAALMNKKVNMQGKKIAAVVSGGNIDVNMVARIIDKALMKEGRRFFFKTMLPDAPGQMSKITGILAEMKANIFSISQTRFRDDIGIGNQQAEIMIETFGAEHKAEIIAALEKAGYVLQY